MELRTNSRGYLQHKHPSLILPPNFPDMKILGHYACPATSVQAGRAGGGAMRDNGDMSLPLVAGFCEVKFIEWGYKSAIIKRFRDLIWEAAVIRVLRRAALLADEREKDKRIAAGRSDSSIRGVLHPSRAEAVGTPAALVKKHLSKPEVDRFAAAFVNQGPSQPSRADANIPDINPLILRIVGSRQHVSTDGILEYRVEVGPTQLVALAESGIKGLRREPSSNNAAGNEFNDLIEGLSPQPRKGPKKPPPEPKSALRMWIPACMMQQVHPALVEEFEATELAKKAKKAVKGKGKAKALAPDDDESDEELESSRTQPLRQPKRKRSDTEENIPPQTTMLEEVSSTNILTTALDPWFLVRDESVAESSSAAPRGFLFSIPNPDDTNILESDEQSPAPCRDEDLGDTDEDMDDDMYDGPPNRFDMIFNQIMGVYGSSSRRKKKATSRRQRPRPSMPELSKASSTDSRTAASKRRKTTGGDEPSLPHTATSAPQLLSNYGTTQPLRLVDHASSLIERYSDCETTPASSNARPLPRPRGQGISSRNVKSLTSAPPRTARRVYPGPSSSQDSGLFLNDAEVIIDLT
jgi:hypothetical protein